LSTVTTAAGTLQQFLDGLAGSSAAHTVTNSTNPYVIGDETIAGLNDGLSMSFGESIVYNKLLTSTERSQIQSYVALKYGITLGNTSNLVSYLASDGTTTTWTGNATYQNNIAGIGRDDLSALYQKQSQSVNTGSQVVMALGTVAASNQANANTIPTDKQFFIWGDDNGSLTTMASTGNSTYNYRFTRVWKTQNTGSFAQNMTVYYPVSAFGNALPATVALLYGTSAASLSNGTASAIAQSSTTTINGASYYVFTVPSAQVANMQFFSFAGTQTAPGGVIGTVLWLKANAGTSTTTDGAAISQWNDQSIVGNNALQATGTNQPIYRNNNTNNVNFNPSVYFDGTNDFMNLTGSLLPIGNSARTIFSTIKPLTASTACFVGWGTPSPGQASGFFNTGTQLILSGNNVDYQSNTFPSIVGSVSLASAVKNTTDNAQIYLNSRQVFSGAHNAGATPAWNTTSTNAFVGQFSSSYFNGNLPEVIIYDSALTSSQVLQIETYEAVKYGITLSRNNDGDGTSGEVISGSILEGDYVASNGTTRIWNSDATYQNNIAGIGRDDLSALYQKQSQSVNSGSHVVMALGTAAVSNQANANTIPTDKQFFIWGDDNGSLSTFVSTGNITYPSRFTRIWKTQNTGSFAQNMTVYYPVSAFGTSLASYVGIIYGSTTTSLSNGSASVIPQSGTTTINGVSYYIFTVPSGQVSGMQFFSFTGNSICYKPGVTVGTTLDTKHGITSLSRAGTSGDNWPMVRKGAWTVLESKTKGFVINRLTAAQIAAIPPANLVEGMMVYDTTNNCMKVYTSTDGGTTFNWQCITTQTCPD
jgi:hypothetical protein